MFSVATSEFSFLVNAPPRVLSEFRQYAVTRKFRADELIYLEGDACDYFNLIISGSLRIYKSGECGREITLYKVEAGESCLLSAFSILSHTTFPAIATADQETRAVLIPAPVFRDWINRHEVWREYIFKLLSGRLTEIISKIEALAFQRVDERIAEFLIRSSRKKKKTIRVTHSDIARELGTAREVVSRILKNFEKENLVSLARGNITVLNSDALFRIRASRSA